MDYDIAMNGGIPQEKLDLYDEDFVKNVFTKENIDALKQINSFHNFTTHINKEAMNNAIKKCDVVTLGLSLLDKWFFEEESDGLVQTSDQHLVEDYLGVESIDLSSSHRVAVSPEFNKVLNAINETIEKPLQRKR